VLVVAVTKVMILSALFSLKEEQDHEEKKKWPLASLSSRLNPRPPTPRTLSTPPFRAGYDAAKPHKWSASAAVRVARSAIPCVEQELQAHESVKGTGELPGAEKVDGHQMRGTLNRVECVLAHDTFAGARDPLGLTISMGVLPFHRLIPLP
jgi:hypothetical protein